MKVQQKPVHRSQLSVALSAAKVTSSEAEVSRPSAAPITFDLNVDGFFRLAQVLQIMSISRSSWYEGMARGVYPKPVSLGLGRAMGYRKSDIKALVEKLSQGADHE